MSKVITVLKKVLKIIGITVAAIIGALVLFAIAMRLSPSLGQTTREWAIRYQVYLREQAVKKDYEMAKKDTFGGKTPADTLKQFIEAVEKKDFTNASKYFVVAKQREWLNKLNRIANSENDFLELLRSIDVNSGVYSGNGNFFSYYKPILFRVMKYPSGNWKIVEI